MATTKNYEKFQQFYVNSVGNFNINNNYLPTVLETASCSLSLFPTDPGLLRGNKPQFFIVLNAPSKFSCFETLQAYKRTPPRLMNVCSSVFQKFLLTLQSFPFHHSLRQLMASAFVCISASAFLEFSIRFFFYWHNNLTQCPI